MEKILDEIVLRPGFKHIDSIVNAAYSGASSLSFHYNQNEEFFIKLPEFFVIPSFPIHHDVSDPTPGKEYVKALTELLKQVIPMAQDVFNGVTYFFDPAEIFHPAFFQVFKYKEQLYLYLVRLDLTYRPNDGDIVKKGSNDTTESYRTKKLFLEADLIPLKGIKNGAVGEKLLTLEQSISQTWIGEKGRGYFIEGIWIDLELTKFLTKLFIPQGKRIYPYYPFTCKYKTFSHSLIDLSLEGRKKHLVYHHKARSFILPFLNDIQKALQDRNFSPDLPEFKDFKAKVPPFWDKAWETLSVSPYLNEHDMKEFKVVF